MGYTHYGGGCVACANEVWAKVIADCKKIVEAAKIPLAGSNGMGKPFFGGNRICFNGKGIAAHETFEVVRPRGFGFCKTAQKPYDIVVCGCLIVLKHHIPEFKPGSDGDAEDWADAIKLCQDVLGYGVYPCGDDVEPTPEPEPVAKPEFEFKRMIPEGVKEKPL